MTTQLVEILRKTLAIIERSDEFQQNEPALVDLRKRVALEIAELEVVKASRTSNKPAEADPKPRREVGS